MTMRRRNVLPAALLIYAVSALAWWFVIYFRSGFFVEAHPQLRNILTSEGGLVAILLLPPVIPPLLWVFISGFLVDKRS
jgi:hypothetical protein